MKEQPERFILIRIAPDEITALNLAITYFLRYCKHVSPVYEKASVLLLRFQRRLREQLPDQQFPPEVRH